MNTEYEDITVEILQLVLWQELVENGEFALLDKLNAVERHGFETVIVPNSGFSKNDMIHNMTIDWLQSRKCNVWSPENEILILERALHGD